MVPFDEAVGRSVQLGNLVPHFTISRVHCDSHGNLPIELSAGDLVDIVAFTNRQGEIVPIIMTVNFGSLTEIKGPSRQTTSMLCS